jgi:hypothetical protein
MVVTPGVGSCNSVASGYAPLLMKNPGQLYSGRATSLLPPSSTYKILYKYNGISGHERGR